MAPYSNKHLNQFKIEFISEINYQWIIILFFYGNYQHKDVGTWYHIPKNNRYQIIIQYNIKKLN
jgi:hypothetical protein